MVGTVVREGLGCLAGKAQGGAAAGGRGEKLLLIDGNSVLYRAFYGVPLLSTSKGLYTNAVYGLAMMLVNLLRDERPTHVAVAFDKGKTTFRHAQFADYKGKRQETPPELIGQFAMARDLLHAFGVRYLEVENYEADDIIGTLSAVAERSSMRTTVVSGDKDLLQLVSPHVVTCLTRKGVTDLVRYDSAQVMERFSLTPAQIIDLKGLMGDASDNIPGVPGVGEKTGIKLLTQFGSVEEVLAHIDDVAGGKLRERLREHREQALLSKRLATIERAAPIDVDLDELRYAGFAADQVRPLFQQYEFRSLLGKLAQGSLSGQRADAGQAGGSGSDAGTGDGVHAGDASDEAHVGYGVRAGDEVHTVAGEAHAPTLHDASVGPDPQGEAGTASGTRARRAGGVAVSDVGTGAVGTAVAEASDRAERLPVEVWGDRLADISGPTVVLVDLDGSYQSGRVLGFVLADATGTWYASIGEDVSDPQAPGVVALLRYLADPDRRKVTYDSKALRVVLVRLGWASDPGDCIANVFDALLATYLIHASEGEPMLDDVIAYALPDDPLRDDLAAQLKKSGVEHAPALLESSTRLLRTLPVLQSALEEQQLRSLYEGVELPLSVVLARMELLGVRVDAERLRAIGRELTEGIKRLTQEIYELAGTAFNIQSPKQLGDILFGKMGLPATKKTKTGYSTSADVLERLAPYSVFVQRILEYRQLAKLQSTYIEGLLAVVRPPDARVHTTFRQAMAATGRLSSQEPNLQNIPIRLEQGRRLRQAFIPGVPGWLIVSADYSQVELRILAHLSGDTALIEAFMQGMDIHTRTASDVFEVPPEQVTALMRRQAKAVNFGIVYGISDYGLSQNLNIPRAQAAAFIEQYFAKFPGVKAYMEQSVQRARDLGYAETVMGRRRYLPQIRSRNFNERSFAERTAMNTPIQGTAADIIKVAMIRLSEQLRSGGWQSRMLLQVHDELIFECPPEELNALTELVRGQMEGALQLRVPLQVDVHAGETWYDAK